MKWIGSSWDRCPRVYVEAKTRKDKSSLVSDDWDDVKAHLLTLHKEGVKKALLAVEDAQRKLDESRRKLDATSYCERPL